MPRATWRLVGGRPVIEITLTSAIDGTQATRMLLADTGAGAAPVGMELILSEADQRRFGVGNAGTLRLGGAFAGDFPAFWVDAAVPVLGFSGLCLAVAVPSSLLPRQLGGIACFRFLNRSSYGNFGRADHFGLETP
jgi:hypothetical protein